MHELKAITAIANATFESMVAKCLFDNGWNVEKRVLDACDISHDGEKLVLISLDLEGLTQELLDSIYKQNSKIILFGPNPLNFQTKGSVVFDPSTDANRVLSIIRGNHRQPLLQRQNTSPKKRARLHYFLSARPGVGTSMIAANSAMHISQKERRVLLIDGDLHFPSLFHYLGVRKLEDPYALTPSLSVVELGSCDTNTTLANLERWMGEFDEIVIDGGSQSHNSELMGDRRREGVLMTWALDYSYSNYLVTTNREIDIHPHSTLRDRVQHFKPQGRFLTLRNMVERLPKNSQPDYAFPKDPRNLQKCEKEKLLLNEGAPRSPLAKAISQFVTEAML